MNESDSLKQHKLSVIIVASHANKQQNNIHYQYDINFIFIGFMFFKY